MRHWLLLVLSILSLVLVGCEKPTPAGAYRDANLAFHYPEGWAVSFQNVGPLATDRVVFARGPDNAVLVLMCVPTESAIPLRDMAVNFAKSRDANVEERGKIGSHSFLDAGPSSLEASREQVGGTEVDGLLQKFTLKVLGIEVAFEGHFARLSNRQRTVYIVTQNSLRDRARARPSFAVILGSFRLAPADGASGG